MSNQSISDQIKATPTKPGVYIFRDSSGNVIYVGKAAGLRNRVRSYFSTASSMTLKGKQLASRISGYEYVLTDSEQEALILENTLIKRYKPRYNIRLKDDKTYPYIKIDLDEEFPRVYFTRRRKDEKGARYFGPFASASSVRHTLELIKKLFPYRSCTKVITGKDIRPCLDYYINRCIGPCIGAASSREYRKVIDQVILFLEGKHDTVIKELATKMDLAANKFQFELAAVIRDQIRAIEKVSQAQKVHSMLLKNEDYIALSKSQNEAWIEIFFVREGKTVGRDHFIMEGTQDEKESHVIGSFVKQFYDSASYVPPLILLQHQPSDTTLITSWLKNKQERHVGLRVPKKGNRKKLLDMVAANAAQGLAQHRIKWMADNDTVARALEELQEQLNLPSLPKRMECYDISHIQGSNPVGSMVVFQNGKPSPSRYRRFKIKTVKGIDDYSMMQEMLRRRFYNLKSSNLKQPDTVLEKPDEDSKNWAEVPDLVLIDGGKGHLSAALQILLELGLGQVQLASIAKQREEIFRPDSREPIFLPRSSQGLYLVQRLRDEAHRFAITFHRQLRKKAGIKSVMDSVPGIGPKRKKALINRFGSVNAIREAKTEEIAAVIGMTKNLAERVKQHI